MAANNFIYEKITTQLGDTERMAGHWQSAIDWFEKARTVSRVPGILQVRIEATKQEMTNAAPNATVPVH